MNHPTIFPIQRFQSIKTPFHYYNLDLLKKTIATVKEETGKYENFHVHYAIKANANKHILSIISENRLGADCVSGGEIQAAVDAGFPADKIVFAGVGKSDWEINLTSSANWQKRAVSKPPSPSASTPTWMHTPMPKSRQD